jgi:hypothetical protein
MAEDPEKAAAQFIEQKDIPNARILDPKAERALCRKLDLRILPFITIMYLFNGEYIVCGVGMAKEWYDLC